MTTPNLAAWFGWQGSLDTDLHFSEFFFADHTVMFRCMRSDHRRHLPGRLQQLRDVPAGFDFTKEQNWSAIARGVPLVGQFVRRPKH